MMWKLNNGTELLVNSKLANASFGFGFEIALLVISLFLSLFETYIVKLAHKILFTLSTRPLIIIALTLSTLEILNMHKHNLLPHIWSSIFYEFSLEFFFSFWIFVPSRSSNAISFRNQNSLRFMTGWSSI